LISEDGKHNTSDSLKRYEASLALLGVTFEGESYPNNMVKTNNGQRYFYQHIQIFANAAISSPFVFLDQKFGLDSRQKDQQLPTVRSTYWQSVYVNFINPIWGALALFFAFLIASAYLGTLNSLLAVLLYVAGGTFLAYNKFNTSNSFTTLILFVSHVVLQRSAVGSRAFLNASLIGFLSTAQKLSMIGNAPSFLLAYYFKEKRNRVGTNRVSEFGVLTLIAVIATCLGLLGFFAVHYIRFGQIFPYVGNEFARLYVQEQPESWLAILQNFMSFWTNPGRSFIFFEPLSIIGFLAFWLHPQIRIHIVYALGCLLSTMLVHSFVDQSWGNMAGNRYINSQAGVLSLFGAIFIFSKVKKTAIKVLIICLSAVLLRYLSVIFIIMHLIMRRTKMSDAM
jgi:hypothetical protein